MSSSKIWSGISRIGRELEKATLASPKTYLKECADVIILKIRAQARLGKTMAYGESAAIKQLTNQKYIDLRKSLQAGRGKTKKTTKAGNAGVGVDPDFFNPSKSNLTVTGQLLDSIKVLDLDLTKVEITIGADGIRKAGPFGGAGVDNASVLAGQRDQGRKILGIDETTRKIIRAIAIAGIRRTIRQNVLKK